VKAAVKRRGAGEGIARGAQECAFPAPSDAACGRSTGPSASCAAARFLLGRDEGPSHDDRIVRGALIAAAA